MRTATLNFTRIVYLDPSLISEAFAEITKTAPVTRVTRSQDLAGNAGVGVFSVTGKTSESREFAVSTTQMFKEVESKLRKYNAASSPAETDPTTPFWCKGFLGVGSHSHTRESEVLKELFQFMIFHPERDPKRIFQLATTDGYFTSGYDQLAANKDMLSHGMWQPVEALLRPLFVNDKIGQSLFAPFVILHLPEPPVAETS